MSESAKQPDRDLRKSMPPNVSMALGLISAGQHAKYDDLGLSEADRLLTATAACIFWHLTMGDKFLSPNFEIDIEDESKVREFFDFPIQSAGNATCQQLASLFGLKLVDGEENYRSGRLQLANAYLDKKNVIILAMSTREKLNRSWEDLDKFLKDLNLSMRAPGLLSAMSANSNFSTAIRVVLLRDQCYRAMGTRSE